MPTLEVAANAIVLLVSRLLFEQLVAASDMNSSQSLRTLWIIIADFPEIDQLKIPPLREGGKKNQEN